MITWHVGKKIEVVDITEKEKKAFSDYTDDLKKAVTIEYYNGTEHGTEEHNVDVHIYDNSSISFSTNDGFIYLYPEQVAELKKLLIWEI